MKEGTKNSHKLMRIGQLARQAGISIRTLRYYEEVGLLRPVDRTESHYRLYDEAALQRLQTIKRMKLLTLKLAEIRRLTQTYEKVGTCHPVRQQLRELVLAHIQQVDEQMAELTLLRQTLQEYLDRTENYFRAAPPDQAEQRCRGALGISETPVQGGQAHARKTSRT